MVVLPLTVYEVAILMRMAVQPSEVRIPLSGLSKKPVWDCGKGLFQLQRGLLRTLLTLSMPKTDGRMDGRTEGPAAQQGIVNPKPRKY